MKPTLYLIAGANGSGKTTMALKFLADGDVEFLNADEIAKSINPDDMWSVAVSAGKELFKRMDSVLKVRASVAIETTLSGNNHIRTISRFKEAGYIVKLWYVFLDTPKLSIERIKVRVAKGGHHVPDEDVIRRFSRSREHFWEIANMADDWILYYNGDNDFIQVAQGAGDHREISDLDLFNTFNKDLK